jgi:hypothetical protein
LKIVNGRNYSCTSLLAQTHPGHFLLYLRQNFVANYRYDLPFGKLLQHANRWTEGDIRGDAFTAGVRVTLVNPNDSSLIGTGNNGVNNSAIDELNVSPGSLQINHDPRNGQPYFHAAPFSLPALGTIGNSGRRFFHGPAHAELGHGFAENHQIDGVQVAGIPL